MVASEMPEVALLTNHAQVLLCVAQQSGARVRDIAECVGVTERAAHRLVAELESAGYLTRHRVGRRNFYEVHPDLPLADDLVDDEATVGTLLGALLPQRDSAAA